MHLYELPMICVLIGLALYTILGGADFGAGLWQLTTLLAPGRTPAARERAKQVREHAHHSMGPVWEANHVWLIFVLTVTWTAYPSAFGAIASTLAVPLLLAGIGVIFRGRRLRPAGGHRASARTRADRQRLLTGVVSDPVRARHLVGRRGLGTGAARQRRREPVRILAQPDLAAGRSPGRRLAAYMAAVYWPPTAPVTTSQSSPSAFAPGR